MSQAPEPVEPWAPKVIDAFNVSFTCNRIVAVWDTPGEDSEDCLLLNIYVPGKFYYELTTSERQWNETIFLTSFRFFDGKDSLKQEFIMEFDCELNCFLHICSTNIFARFYRSQCWSRQ